MLNLYNKFIYYSSRRFLIKRLIGLFVKQSADGQCWEIVLDVGGGKGPYRRFINHRQWWIMDIEKRGQSDKFIKANANQRWPIKDKSVDLVLATEVLEHIYNPQFFLAEARRVLKKGGALILTTPFLWKLHEEPNDYFRYSIYGLKYLMKEAGWREFKVTPSNGFFYSLCQIVVINLHSPFWRPLILLINGLGLLFSKIKRPPRFYLSNFVVGKKL